jgi:two-component system chemotaxis response regulator CheB
MDHTPSIAVAIGASAGAVEALGRILPALPARFPWPIFVVVHVPARVPSMLVPLFRPRCALRVSEVEDKCPIEPGNVYFCPPDYHLLIESPRALALSIDEPVKFSRPSIDVLFESVADVYGAAALGVVLSGANDDGACGLAAILRAGGRGFVQDPATAVARPMPDAALRAAPAAAVLAPAAIAEALCKAARHQAGES